MNAILNWIEDRTGIGSLVQHFLNEDIPASSGWKHVLGSVALFAFLIQATTGVLLALNYAPTVGEAYASVKYILTELTGGSIIRSVHHWGASLMIIVVVLHMAQVFIWGAYKKPREVTWMALFSNPSANQLSCMWRGTWAPGVIMCSVSNSKRAPVSFSWGNADTTPINSISLPSHDLGNTSDSLTCAIHAANRKPSIKKIIFKDTSIARCEISEEDAENCRKPRGISSNNHNQLSSGSADCCCSSHTPITNNKMWMRTKKNRH